MKKKKTQLMTTYKVVKGNVFSTALVLGGCALSLSFIVPMILTMPTLVNEIMISGVSEDISWLILYGLFLVIGLVMTFKGFRLRGRTKRFKRYAQAIGYNDAIDIQDLAQLTNKSPKYVLKDIKKMVDDQLISDAYLDQQQGQLIIGQANYLSYLADKQVMIEENIVITTGHEPLDQMIAQGKDYLQQLDTLAKTIGKPQIVDQIGEISNTTDNIFQVIITHPEKLADIRRFMDYYLPTTLKLLNAYKRYHGQSTKGANIFQAMTQIEAMLVTIKQAFNNLLNNLNQDDTLDILTDMTALENMLAQEGLTGHNFETNTMRG